MKTTEVRKRYLEFFKSKAHPIVKSDSLVPVGDPSLLFTGAGMNQFKDYFLGIKKDLKRACSSQKCLRTGDLDNVGETAYHLSFFEMLGNFSFGDYFKKEAIEWAWELLTKEFKIPKERLRISVHHSDDEAYNIWLKHIGIREDFIAKLGDDSNFWPANAPKDGPNGPCGPCSEIYFDQGENYSTNKTKGAWYQDESGRFAEIWNLVFTQFDRQADGTLEPLAAKNIDTGMGLERIACVLQGKRSNFEIDLFQPMIRKIRQELNVSEGHASLIHAIVDHGRAVTFSIADGAYPSNEGRGYVIRKLIRRSIWRAHEFKIEEAFLHKIVPAVIEQMGDQYPELAQAEKNVTQTIKQEEERFLETLEKGVLALDKLLAEATKRKDKKLKGEDVFLLYDTYGFPDELTSKIASKNRIGVDQDGFNSLMAEQRKRAKDSSKIASSIFTADEAKQEVAHLPPTKFLGYETLEADAKVLWMKQIGDQTLFVLDQTPFYPESGGQVGDKGLLLFKGSKLTVVDVQRRDRAIVHIGTSERNIIKVGDIVRARVDNELRGATKRNHTATHLLQAALRQILGSHVRQVGSLVNSEKLRFDFTHGQALTREEIMRVEDEINRVILDNRSVDARTESYKQATQGGAIAFFGDKYGDEVRVIDIPEFSKELCGGTHCNRTGDIGSFVILSDSAIASGTRRIEATTGLGALKYLQANRKTLRDAAETLKSTPDQLVERIGKLQSTIKELEKGSKSKAGSGVSVDELLTKAEVIKNVSFVSGLIPNAKIDDLRAVWDQVRKKKTSSVAITLGSISDDKLSLIAGISSDLLSTSLHAGELIKDLASICDGSGGGKKDFAQGGGKNIANVQKVFDRAKAFISERLGS